MTESFPRLQARTRRFTLGTPTDVTISPDGRRIVYLQSTGPVDPVKRLMTAAVAAEFAPIVVADPARLLNGNEELSVAEKARRERLRESGAGIVGFSVDDELSVAAFGLSGAVGIATLDPARGEVGAKLLDVTGPAIDPRVDPTGQRVAWVADRSLFVSMVDGSEATCLAASQSESHTWGLANFLAAEEFDRIRGYWWSPDGQSLLVEEVDESRVDTWFISDPTNPSVPPRSVRYPAVGRPNPTVRLWLVNLAGDRVEIQWDHDTWEYLVSVRWNSYGRPLVTLFDRLQRNGVVLSVNPSDGSSEAVARMSDPAWVSIVPGTPTWTADGDLLTTYDSGIVETVAVGGVPLELLPDWQVAGVLESDDDGVLLAVQPEATTHVLLFIDREGIHHELTPDEQWASGVYRGGTLYTARTTLNSSEWTRELSQWQVGDDRPTVIAEVPSMAMTPPVDVNANPVAVGERELNAVVLWPHGHTPGSQRLPVVMNPYGGPHAQRVISVGRAFAEAQWLADQGFAVIVADGRGSPGRGPAWERTISGDLATFPLDDQIDALHGIADRWPDDIDLDRVGITGWSFGGYLAALAVLRRPDVFRAAVAGAPVTEWRLYDSAYTERYLGDAVTDVSNYDATSLLPMAPSLERPLMIIHGMADDNVVVAHSLQLSAALTAAGRPHTFVPLANVTHMTPQEEVAENLLKLEVDFFLRNL